MAEELVIVGAGGFGREVVELVRAINESAFSPLWLLAGVVDDHPAQLNLDRLNKLAVSHLGSVDHFLSGAPVGRYVVGIGSPAVRRSIATKFDRNSWHAATLVHPTATVGTDVSLGDGTIVCAGARLTTNITTGKHVHVDTNATVGHDVSIGAYSRLNPASSISGDCTIGSEVLIGVAAAVLNGLAVGDGAVVGGSACVVRDVQRGAVVKGVPAR